MVVGRIACIRKDRFLRLTGEAFTINCKIYDRSINMWLILTNVAQVPCGVTNCLTSHNGLLLFLFASTSLGSDQILFNLEYRITRVGVIRLDAHTYSLFTILK